MSSKTTRRRRQRRFAAAAVVGIAVAVAAVTSLLWRQARVEAQRAEASKLLAVAQLRLEEDPTEALAYTTASLELSDTREARIFALRVLWDSPPALEIQPENKLVNRAPRFSPDGSYLAAGGQSEDVHVWSSDGTDVPITLPKHELSGQGAIPVRWASNELLVTGDPPPAPRRAQVWKIPEGQRIRTIDFGARSWFQTGPNRILAEVPEESDGARYLRLRSWELPDGEARDLGRVSPSALETSSSMFTGNGKGWVYTKGSGIYVRDLPVNEARADRLVGRHVEESARTRAPHNPHLTRVHSTDASGGILRWSIAEDKPELEKVVNRHAGEPTRRMPDPTTRWAMGRVGPNQSVPIWNLDAWAQTRPMRLRRGSSWYIAGATFHPRGDWIVVSTGTFNLTFWPLKNPWSSVVDGFNNIHRPVAFSPDGRWLATTWAPSSNAIRLWPLPGNESREPQTLPLPSENQIYWDLEFDPRGRFIAVSGGQGQAYIAFLDGSPPRRLEGFSNESLLGSIAVSPSGRRVASAFTYGRGSEMLGVWDLETGDRRLFDLPDGSPSSTGYEQGVKDTAFADESTLYTAGDGGVRRWDLDTGSHELVLRTEPRYRASMRVASDRKTALVRIDPLENYAINQPIEILDLERGKTRALPAFGERFVEGRPLPIAVDASGTLAASGDWDGIVRVGRISDGEPHLLVGHEGSITYVEISPDGRWVASTGEDNTLRLWPMPNLDAPPLHTLSRDELLAKLKSLTNFRVVRDPDSAEGWKVELDPFPGWKDVPQWQ